MKTQLLKKIYAFITTAMLFSASATAQIVYTDINPDSTIIRTTIPGRGSISTEQTIDVNNDGIPDLKFTLVSRRITPFNPGQSVSITGSVSATPLNGSALLTDSSGYPAKMSLNDSIDANANWSTIASQILISKTTSSTTITLGDWNTATDGFLGLRFIVGAQTHYCWIRLNVEAFTSGANAAILVIKDFAYNSIPDQLILAGESTTSGIIENSGALSIHLFPNPSSNHLTIALRNETRKVKVSIVDITGKVIYTLTETNTQNVEVNTSELKEGIYVVEIQAEDFTLNKKLVVKK
jgi:hypothetical protein